MNAKPVLAALVATTIASAMLGDRPAAAAPRLSAPAATATQQAAPKPTPGSRDRLQLTFREGTDVRLRGGALVSPSGSVDLSGVQALLGPIKGHKVERLFRGSEAELARMKATGEKRAGRKLPDLNLGFVVRLPKGADIMTLATALAKLDVVADATPEPLPTASPTPDFTARQAYGNAAPAGINVGYAAGLPGGTGGRVKIIDIEYSWNVNHEDLAKARSGLIQNGTPVDPFNDTDHGTAVLGELIGSNNGFGVTGLVPDAAISMVNATNTAGYEVHNAILTAANNLQAGDLILLEQQIAGPNFTPGTSQFGLVPVEWNLANYNAIRTATAKGIIVVEAAGNGHQNLDDPIYGGLLSAGGRADSGAIIVGAGNAPNPGGDPNCGSEPARSRIDFSNYGSRVDVQAWGECVTTTGYGHLQSLANATYTGYFGGTSGASPIVTGAAAILSSVVEARTGVAPTPAKVRSILKSTGNAQATGLGTLAGNIGPMPDLAKAIPAILADTTAPAVGTVSQTNASNYIASATSVPTTISWSAADASGIVAYDVRYSRNGGAWQLVTLSSATATSKVLGLSPGSTYTFTVSARDGAGNWSAWRNGPTFTPTLIAENNAGITFSTGWTRSAYTPAIGGYVTVSGTTGAWATVTFTGRSIAWIGTMATSRGEADIWVDGVYQRRINLYSATTYPSTVLFSKNVATGVTHTLKIKVVGTVGRPKVDIDAFAILK